jgi:predicted phosphodiesterase
VTTLAILADIHGNLPALEAVLADLAPFAVDQVIVAGDMINWGPFSAQVMARVVEGGWAVIRGNNEFYLTDYQTPRAPAEWSNLQSWLMLSWLRQQLAGRWTTVIAGWPDSLSLRFPDAPAIRVMHGSPRANNEPIYPGSPQAEVAEMLVGVEETTVIAAHTHLPVDRQVPGRPDGAAWRVLNPGSVGVPLDGCFVSRYLLLEGTAAGWTATAHEVPLDPAPVLREFERQDFSAVCGIVGYFVTQEFRHARLELPTFLSWRRTTCPDRPLTRDLLADYARVDPLDYVHEANRAGWTRSQAGERPLAELSPLP